MLFRSPQQQLPQSPVPPPQLPQSRLSSPAVAPQLPQSPTAQQQFPSPPQQQSPLHPQAAATQTFVKKTERPDAMRQFVGAIVRIPVAAGEPIRDPAVVFAKGSGFLAAVLTKGMRAVSMEVSAENGAGGFILPDDHVDVLLTRRDKAAEKLIGIEKIISEAILRNVRVLAIDQSVEEKAGQKVVVGKTATLELNPDQAETLALSRQLGTLSLALRSLADVNQAEIIADDRSRQRGSVNVVRFGINNPTMVQK